MDAVHTYLSQGANARPIDHLLQGQRILFCCYSRLMATLWVRSERGRSRGKDLMPGHLVGACTTEAEAMELFLARRPTLVICTQLLEDGSGLRLVTEMKRIEPEVPTVLFLQHRNTPLFYEAVKTHSDGIVLETEMGSGHVVEALKVVSNGGMYLEPVIGRELAGSGRGQNPGLTARELEVMQQVVLGLNDREIGERLFISNDTVKYHLKAVYGKLGAHNRTRAAVSLVLMGLVAPPKPLLPASS